MRKLNCFIACAFGKHDVDNIYKNAISKVLNELNINPLRVDKIDFLGKIDSKIINLIKQSDFCISDLSYARPSVYFEAGFTEGLSKKVIYTVRNDHFSLKTKDINENFRIHFDKITENIIGWKSPNKNFKNKLKKRINFVILPIKQKLKEQEISENEKNKFNRLSLIEKIDQMEKRITQIFLDKKYNLLHKGSNKLIFQNPKISNDLIFCLIDDNFLEKSLKSFNPYYNPYIVFPQLNVILESVSVDNISTNSNKIKKIVLVFFSIKNIPETRIQKCFPDFHKNIIDIKEYSHISSTLKKKFRFLFIDNIISLRELENKILSFKKL
jgi:hypothetical protein